MTRALREIRILRHLRTRPGSTVVDIARTIGIPEAQAEQVLTTLRHHDRVEELDGRWALRQPDVYVWRRESYVAAK